MTGIELIAQERGRQIEQERYTAEHDAGHTECELVWAAMHYALPCPIFYKCHCGQISVVNSDSLFEETGWDMKLSKRHRFDRIRQLTVAGALIAAEIDRLQGEAE